MREVWMNVYVNSDGGGQWIGEPKQSRWDAMATAAKVLVGANAIRCGYRLHVKLKGRRG